MAITVLINILCFSFGITFCLIPFLRLLAFKTGILDIPHGALKKHEKPTPYLGGVGVFIGFLGAIFITRAEGVYPSFFFIGLSVLVCVGFIDDLYSINPLKKIMGQLFACLCFLKADLIFKKDIFLTVLPNFLHIPLVIHGVSYFLTVWWMLALMNAFNLVDVMDGLATIIALVAALGFLGWALILKKYLVAMLLSALIGALVAFLWYNKPRASIYLGDAGSLFLGGYFAVLPFFFDWGGTCRSSFFVPLLILMVPILELCGLMVIRYKKGLPVYYGSPHHFICYLKARGFSLLKILGVTFLAGASFGTLALLVAFLDIAPLRIVLCAASFVCLWSYFIYFKQKTSFFL